jgi:hypothetical protein
VSNLHALLTALDRTHAGLWLGVFCVLSMLLGGLKFATSPAFDAPDSPASATTAPAMGPHTTDSKAVRGTGVSE